MVLTGTDAQTVRPYNGLLVSLVRGRVTRIAGSGTGYSYRFDTTSYSSLRLFFVILIAIPACHIVFDVSRYIVALFAIPNDTIIVP